MTDKDIIKLNSNLYYINTCKFLNENEESFLKNGLTRIKDKIHSNSPFKNTLITIKDIKFNPCDYQESGLEVAIIEWASNIFNFEKPEFNVTFDKTHKKYII